MLLFFYESIWLSNAAASLFLSGSGLCYDGGYFILLLLACLSSGHFSEVRNLPCVLHVC